MAELEAEPDLPYTRDFEKPLGRLTIVLSDSHGNSAHVACDVRHPGDSSIVTMMANATFPGQLTVNVSLVTSLECEIDREMLQNLWQLVAYYYEYPAILERGQQRGSANASTYQYGQYKDEKSPYFTDLKGYLGAEPAWLLQPKVTLKLNREQTSSKKLVMEFATVITKHVNSRVGQEDGKDFTWALIRKRSTGQIQTALEGSKTTLECSVITSDPEVKLEWILPDLSVVEDGKENIKITEKGQLIVLNVSLSDSGLYHCMVRSKTGVDLVPIRLTVKERILNPAAINGEKIVVKNGQSFSLPCEVKSVQPSLTIWYLPKGQVLLPTQKTSRVEVMENGTLVVHRSMREDKGEYSCLASNLHGVDMLSHLVEVTGPKANDGSRMQTYREQPTFPSATQEEGSGGNDHEMIHLFSAQVPNKSETQKRKSSVLPKKTRFNGSKRKTNFSIKKVDPNDGMEITKSKSNPTALPTVWSITEPNNVSLSTGFYESTSATAATLVTTVGSYVTERESPTQFPQTLPPSTTEQTKHTEPGSDKESSNKGTAAPSHSNRTQPNDKRRIYSLVPGSSNRRRPPYRRRRPPMRRLRTQVPLSYDKSNNTQPTVLPLPTSKTSTTETEKEERIISERSPTIQTKVNNMLIPIEDTVKNVAAINPKKNESSRLEKIEDFTLKSEKNQVEVTTLKSTRENTVETKSTEKSEVKVPTQHDGMSKKTLTTHGTFGRDTQSSVVQNTQTQTRTSSLKTAILNATTGGEPKAESKTHVPPVMEPVHPWLHHSKEAGGRTDPSGKPHSNRNKIPGKQINSGVPPLSRWPSKHHHHHFYPLYPTWPGHSFPPHLQHGK